MPQIIGVIYATGSKMIRRFIIDSANNFDGHVGLGESLLVMQSEQMTPSLDEMEQAIETATGVRPVTIRCALVDKDGITQNIILADPDIDKVDGYTLVPIEP